MRNSNLLEFKITPLTLALLSKETKEGKLNTFIMEEKRDYVVQSAPIQVIDYACRVFGSTLKGRLEGGQDINQVTYKSPVAIDPSSGMYFFPTASPTNKNCSWIAHSHVKSYKPINQERECEITFYSGDKLQLAVSYRSILNQIQRTAQFRFTLDRRMNVT